jgi:hypothetical protein
MGLPSWVAFSSRFRGPPTRNERSEHEFIFTSHGRHASGEASEIPARFERFAAELLNRAFVDKDL